MDIVCIGGGPAALYFSILMKKADPSHRIRLFERNALGDTFGFGVVFSEETLGNLQAADAESYAAITGAFVRWDEIEVRYRGRVIRSGGHGFCGLSRKKLLEILHERATSLGVEIQYRSDIVRLADAPKADLVVAADGVNSAIRAELAARLEPKLDVRKCRYIWLGTTLPLEAFTFSFRETEHGTFQIHAYQFDASTSTFIVECTEETWRAAGLDRADEAQSIAHCEKVFAADLGGHRLIGNRSRWIQFATVRNAHWSVDNVVLLGDAAHTAHFSIGSGTKLAMEDAIALADAFAKEEAVPLALAAYEAERRPVVERTQKAAQDSLEWFENVKRYEGFAPEQFAFSLLTRSRRISHDNLRVRDPAFVERTDRWFAEQAMPERKATEGANVPPMFTPFTLRGMKLENRVVVSPMCQYSAEDGMPNDWHLVHNGSRAVGGAGLVMVEMTDVSREGRITPGCAGMYLDAHVPAWKRIVDFVHAHSRAKIGLQLAHAGRKGSTKVMWDGIDEPLDEGNWEVLGPSPLAYSEKNQVPRAMTRADMDKVVRDFVRAAERGIEAGFDLLEVHFAHGYLLSSFLTPLSNQRTDEYGGSLENRLRFPMEVFDAVRRVWPAERPMSVRISATDWVEGGFTGADAVEVALRLKASGCDVIDVSAGQTSPLSRPVYGRAFQTPFSDRVRNEARLPTMAVGNISSADEINSIVLAGRADLCMLARPHLADPYFTLHAAAAQGHEAQPWPSQYLSAKPRTKR